MRSVLLSKVSHLWMVIYASTRVYTRQSWTWHRLTFTPRVLGVERDQEQCDTSQTGSFCQLHRQQLLGLTGFSFCVSLFVSLSLSLSHTHTHTHTHTGHSYSHALFPSWVIESFSNISWFTWELENVNGLRIWLFFLLWSKILTFIPWFRK